MPDKPLNIYLVGGAVRDALLKLPVGDRDWVVVGASVAQMIDLGYQQVGKDFPVFLHPQSKEEYALARTETKTGSGYTGFAVNAANSVTLEEDLGRRDLTINAIAKDSDGRLIDPYNGVRDINARLLRHVSKAFVEDPVRILRTARFAARYAQLGFCVAPETLALMSEMVRNGEVDALTPERVWKDTEKALLTDSPAVYFEVLRECGALARIFPEVDRLWGVPQPPKWHPEIDTGVHTMMVLTQAALLSDSLAVRFAALTHDLGKADTPKEILPGHHGHEKRSLPHIEALCSRLRVPNACKDLALLVAEHHGKFHRVTDLKATTLLKLLMRLDALRRPERFELAILACEADARGRTGLEKDPYPQADFLRSAQRCVAAVDIKKLDLSELSGERIAEKIYAERLRAVKQLLRNDSSA